MADALEGPCHLRIGSHSYCRCANALALGLPSDLVDILRETPCSYNSFEAAHDAARQLFKVGVTSVRIKAGRCGESELS